MHCSRHGFWIFLLEVLAYADGNEWLSVHLCCPRGAEPSFETVVSVKTQFGRKVLAFSSMFGRLL